MSYEYRKFRSGRKVSQFQFAHLLGYMLSGYMGWVVQL